MYTDMNIDASMAAHIPSRAFKSLELFTRFDRVSLLFYKNQREAFERYLEKVEHKMPTNLHLIGHDIPLLPNEVPQYGAIRGLQQDVLQEPMNPIDCGIMADQDVVMGSARRIDAVKLRLYHSLQKERAAFLKKHPDVCKVKYNWGGRKTYIEKFRPELLEEYIGLWINYSTKLTPRSLVSYIEPLAMETFKRGLHHFTLGSSSSPKNAKARKGEYYLTHSFSGLLGIGHDTPNLWDRGITVGEDAKLQAQLMSENGGPCILECPNTAFQMKFEKKKYQDGGPQDVARESNIQAIMDEFPDIFNLVGNFRYGGSYLRPKVRK
jgi:hypothetical protein